MDSEIVISDFEKFGVPKPLNSFLMEPSGFHPDSFAHIDTRNYDVSRCDGDILHCLVGISIFASVVKLLGIQVFEDDEGELSGVDTIQQILNAGVRAIKVQAALSGDSIKQ